MSAARNRFFYLGEQSFTTSGELDSMFFTESSSNGNNNINHHINNTNQANNPNNNDEEKEFDESELLPCSSSSVDRSSVGSIPWADDAIKQHQLDWERVELMLAGEEQTLNEEAELAQEIREWQEKFPHLLRGDVEKRTKTFKVQQSFDSSRTNIDESLDIDTISNASLDSSGNEALDEVEDGFATPTQGFYQEDLPQKLNRESLPTPGQRQRMDSVADLAQLLGRNLRISSVPLTWRRQGFAKSFTRQSTSYEQSEMSPTLGPPPPPPRRSSPQYSSLVIAPSQRKAPLKERKSENNVNTRARMPPILNVLETKRRFRGLANNRSFVQLTQLQQTKSAAIMPHQNSARIAAHSQVNPKSWQVPSGRFLSQRNSVILPAIDMRRIHEHRSTDTPLSASSSTSLTPSHTNSQQPSSFLQQQYVLPARQHFPGGNSSSTPSTSGRSISAAVHHPRLDLSAFYLPYSVATKFKSFNKM